MTERIDELTERMNALCARIERWANGGIPAAEPARTRGELMSLRGDIERTQCALDALKERAAADPDARRAQSEAAAERSVLALAAERDSLIAQLARSQERERRASAHMRDKPKRRAAGPQLPLSGLSGTGPVRRAANLARAGREPSR